MRSRICTAAAITLAGAFLAAAPAYAQGKSVPAPKVSALKVNSAALLRPGMDRRASQALAAPARGFSLFGRVSEFTPGGTAFSLAGDGFGLAGAYSRGAVLGPLTPALPYEAVTLRDLAVSGRVAPRLSLDVARWQDPVGVGLWDSRVAGVFDTPLRAGSDLRSPYVGLGAAGYFVGASVALTENLSVHAGRSFSTATPVLESSAAVPAPIAARLNSSTTSIETTAAGLDWSFADWAGVGVTASRTREAGSLLGVIAPGGTESAAVGISARVGFGEGWVTTLAYNEGVSRLDLSQNGLMGSLDPVRTQAYGLSISKHGLFGDDVLGIAVSRPVQIFGNASFAGLNDAAKTGAVLRPNAAAESDIQVGYVTTFLAGALALQANAAYQVNANGDKGQDAVSVLSRAKIKF